MITSDISKPSQTTLKERGPIWHTLLFVLYLLVPVSRWPGARTLMLKTHGTLTLKIYVFDILFQLVGIGFVCVGLYLAATPFGKLIGNHWAGINDAIRDIWLGVLFWLVAIGLSVIMYFVLGPSYDRPSRVLPRTSLE